MGLFYYSDQLGQRCASPEHPLLVGVSIDLIENIFTIRLQSPGGTASATLVLTMREFAQAFINEEAVIKRTT